MKQSKATFTNVQLHEAGVADTASFQTECQKCHTFHHQLFKVAFRWNNIKTICGNCLIGHMIKGLQWRVILFAKSKGVPIVSVRKESHHHGNDGQDDFLFRLTVHGKAEAKCKAIDNIVTRSFFSGDDLMEKQFLVGSTPPERFKPNDGKN